MSEQQKILEMIEKGQISASEGMELLEALQGIKTEQPLVTTSYNKTKYKFLKIKVLAEDGKINVNVNVPIRLLLTIGEISSKMTSFIPAETRKEMEEKGIDITSIDFAKIIEEIINGTLDDPTIIDVEVNDKEHGSVLVKIYVE
ncbi:MAG: hypothetical protein CVU84_15755 [Firmicutes bacterium HGW-Firmicutes-1]|jgi:hypothetical protein|nr:MAG: hypothetical protein CVU84_15755 [Firmicutes bacterium HGW-Firmicutes-1]